MDPVIVGLIGSVLLIILFLLGMHVAFAMGFVGFIGFSYINSLKTGMSIVPRDLFEQFASYPLSAIPMFMLMGSYAYVAGMGKRLFNASYKIMGNVRGGLAISTIFGCAGFAAICGSPTATAAAMGKIALPEMRKYGYPDVVSTATVASGGILGPLIPPSTTLIVYGFLTEQSIGKLFIAGLIPGILLAILFSFVILILSKKYPSLTHKTEVRVSTFEKFKSFLGCVDSLILFFLVVFGLYLGFFTPTQGGGIGAAGALIIGLLRREINLKNFFEATKEALIASCMVLTIIGCAIIFGHFLAVSNVPALVKEWVVSLNLPPIGVFILIVAIYVIGGCFIDALPLIILTLPLFYPIIVDVGYDPIWFGVIIVLLVGIGILTPPVGVNVYVVKGIVPDVPLETIFRGTYVFLLALLFEIFVLLVFPEIATYLPSLM
ncbi:MAG: TRAP transporter large permease [Deltaproteobacteria bacterium]|nr:TRAP transporter large permease [Deltaproteobacteria bacterium]